MLYCYYKAYIKIVDVIFTLKWVFILLEFFVQDNFILFSDIWNCIITSCSEQSQSNLSDISRLKIVKLVSCVNVTFNKYTEN